MEVTIHKAEGLQFELVRGWWTAAGIEYFAVGELPKETTFIAKVNGKPVLCVGLCAPCFGAGWLEALVSNPRSTKRERGVAMPVLLEYVSGVAKWMGAKRLICLSPEPRLTALYQRLGFEKVATVETMIKEIV